VFSGSVSAPGERHRGMSFISNRGLSDSGRKGFLILEAALGISLLLAVFFAIISLYRFLWMELKAEQAAASVVHEAAVIPEAPGSHRSWVLDEGSVAEAAWDDEYVRVRVCSAGGRVVVERMLPREAR